MRTSLWLGKMFIFACMLFGFITFEQAAEVLAPFPDTSDLSKVSIKLTRSSCFGTCPDYSVTISGDGTVHYSGKYRVLIPGDHVSYIRPAAVRELLDQFRKANFFAARDRYRYNATDLPTYVVSLTIGSQTKTVIDYYGIKDGMPATITNLEDQIDKTADTARWIESNDNTVPALRAEKWPFGSSDQRNLNIYVGAVKKKNNALVNEFLAAKTPISTPSQNGDIPICVATQYGDLSLVQRMIAATTTFSEKVLNQCFASAARSGNLAMLQFWLDRGANPKSSQNKSQLGAESDLLPSAIQSRNIAIVRKLLEYKLNLNTTVGNQTLLSWALFFDVMQHNPDKVKIDEIIVLLIHSGVDINARDHSGRTALMENAFVEDAVRWLLTAGADPTLVAPDGRTALRTAQEFRCLPCVRMIQDAIAARAKLTQSPQNDRPTPLFKK